MTNPATTRIVSSWLWLTALSLSAIATDASVIFVPHRHENLRRRVVSTILLPPPGFIQRALYCRGGGSEDSRSSFPQQDEEDDEYAPPMGSGQQETFQDRIDAWKRHQQEQQQQQQQQYAPTPPFGTSPPAAGTYYRQNKSPQPQQTLLTSVSKGSRALIFFILLWRSVYLYETADARFQGLTRVLVVVPLCLLFLANLAGVVASFTSSQHSAKKRLKAILNLDKLVECLLILHNFLRLTLVPSKYIPREVYIASTLHSVFFILQAQAFTRVNWDQVGVADSNTFPTTATPGFSSAASTEQDNTYEQSSTSRDYR